MATLTGAELLAAQLAALSTLVDRPLTDVEVATLTALLDVRNDVATAALLSIGRARLVSRTITARGVRGALPIPDAARFLKLLSDTASAEAVPAWLDAVLTLQDVPESDHGAYLDTFACAHEWLQQAAGLDLGDRTTRAGLDLIAASNPDKFGVSVATLKAMAEVADPIPFDQVSRALNEAQGLMTL